MVEIADKEASLNQCRVNRGLIEETKKRNTPLNPLLIEGKVPIIQVLPGVYNSPLKRGGRGCVKSRFLLVKWLMLML